MKVRKYNIYSIYKNNYFPEEYRSEHFTPELVALTEYFEFKYGPKSLVDRTGNTPHFFNMELEQFPVVPKGFHQTFEEVCAAEAKKYIGTGKTINVFWSGGLDSTSVLFSLIQHAPPEQLRVIMNYNTIVECGSLFDHFIKDKIEYHMAVAVPRNHLIYQTFNNNNNIFISGAQGDQLFGRWTEFRNYSWETMMKPYETHEEDKILRWTESTLKASPRPIKTVADYFWYFMFNWNWQALKYEYLFDLDIPTQKRIHNFFGAEDFQRWSISNHEPALTDGNHTYKWPARNLIYKYTGDKTYAYTKAKHGSIYGTTSATWRLYLQNGMTI